MAKFTNKELANSISELFVDITPEALVVNTTEGKGKNKKEVVDEEATWEAIKSNLLYYRGLIDGVLVASPVLPNGSDEVVNERMSEFDVLYAYAEENFADEMEAFVDEMGIESFGTYDADEEEEEDEEESSDIEDALSELELDDLKAIAKELGVKVAKKDDEESIIAKILENAEEDDILALLSDEEDEEDESDEDEEEESEDEETDYSSMSLAELRAECKSRGIKYTPKQKAEELIAILEENDAESDEEEEEDGIDISELEDDQLKEIAKALGMKAPKLKKADHDALVAFIEEQDEEEVGNVLSELFGVDEEDEDESEDEESDEDEEIEEDEEEDEVDYSSMSLGELRKECKSRGIKFTPKQKAEDLIELLESIDVETEDEDEEDESDEEEVDEHELDEILDEEFEDEVLEKEEAEEKKTSKKGGKLPPKKNKR